MTSFFYLVCLSKQGNRKKDTPAPFFKEVTLLFCVPKKMLLSLFYSSKKGMKKGRPLLFYTVSAFGRSAKNMPIF
jgi:hypothetical protein